MKEKKCSNELIYNNIIIQTIEFLNELYRFRNEKDGIEKRFLVIKFNFLSNFLQINRMKISSQKFDNYEKIFFQCIDELYQFDYRYFVMDDNTTMVPLYLFDEIKEPTIIQVSLHTEFNFFFVYFNLIHLCEKKEEDTPEIYVRKKKN